MTAICGCFIVFVIMLISLKLDQILSQLRFFLLLLGFAPVKLASGMRGLRSVQGRSQSFLRGMFFSLNSIAISR